LPGVARSSARAASPRDSQIQRGVLVVDEAQLSYPSDLLHEAAHLAVAPAAGRNLLDGDTGDDGGEEMGAVAWSYAAALHLRLDPAVVFHAHGYRGDSVAARVGELLKE
jgi:hypothetical protein